MSHFLNSWLLIHGYAIVQKIKIVAERRMMDIPYPGYPQGAALWEERCEIKDKLAESI